MPELLEIQPGVFRWAIRPDEFAAVGGCEEAPIPTSVNNRIIWFMFKNGRFAEGVYRKGQLVIPPDVVAWGYEGGKWLRVPRTIEAEPAKKKSVNRKKERNAP